MFFAQKEPKSAKEVFQLYFEAFVNEKPDAMAKLNEYLKPINDNEDYYTDTNIDMLIRMYIASVEVGFFDGMNKKVAQECHTDFEKYMHAHLHNVKNATYKITKLKTARNDWDKSQKITTVHFTVFVKTSTVETLTEKPAEEITIKEMKYALKKDTEGLMNPNIEMEFEMSFDLYQNKKDGNIYYSNLDPADFKLDLINVYFGVEDEMETDNELK
ncbi:MAG: hypothetical protein Q4G16_04230 [Cruoricaptor ignavus]|nr:hypothetical protein [Cruoricaptor ignavus]